MKKAHLCRLIDKKILAGNVVDMKVQFSEDSKPGQFIHVSCGEGVFLRRPISICDAGDGWLRFTFAVRGRGTKLLAQYKSGDFLNILGPLGNSFNTDKKGGKTSLVVGGGIGIFPLLYLSKSLGSNTEAILGFRTKNLIVMEDEFKSVCSRVHIATDDGSCGHKGFVTDILEERIAKGGISSVYTCGPAPMMAAVKRIAESNGIYCQVSLEERMGCGIGICAVCVCKSKGEYVKICQNGPVFDSEEVDFDD